jgi:catechol 2,3-dioxygenase-like lactoylglutathione lyase family enzyme
MNDRSEIVSVSYMVDDVEKAVAFYTKLLDFEVLGELLTGRPWHWRSRQLAVARGPDADHVGAERRLMLTDQTRRLEPVGGGDGQSPDCIRQILRTRRQPHADPCSPRHRIGRFRRANRGWCPQIGGE